MLAGLFLLVLSLQSIEVYKGSGAQAPKRHTTSSTIFCWLEWVSWLAKVPEDRKRSLFLMAQEQGYTGVKNCGLFCNLPQGLQSSPLLWSLCSPSYPSLPQTITWSTMSSNWTWATCQPVPRQSETSVQVFSRLLHATPSFLDTWVLVWFLSRPFPFLQMSPPSAALSFSYHSSWSFDRITDFSLLSVPELFLPPVEASPLPSEG